MFIGVVLFSFSFIVYERFVLYIFTFTYFIANDSGYLENKIELEELTSEDEMGYVNSFT